MEVVKRNGRKVPYNENKIVNAVKQAMKEANLNNIDEKSAEVAVMVRSTLYSNFYEENKVPSVEEIQDIVENKLIRRGYSKTAKKYILYREKRNKVRNKESKTSLSKEFLSKYKHQPNPFPTELGEFIYYRTYSRWLPKQLRREYWWETVKRAVEYNTSLAPTSKEEKEKLFDNVYNLRNFLAGRTLWTGGTKASREYPMSNYNCSFTVVDSFKAYEDIFYLLMIGAGVGIRVLPEDVEKLPKVRTDFEIIHQYYEPLPKDDRKEFTSFGFEDKGKLVRVNVGDSKEGWVQALRYYFEFLYKHEYKTINKIIFNYNSVRPKGERLKTFGGTASGHESIKEMFTKITKIFKNRAKKVTGSRIKLKPIDALDIANIIGENVVSGGVRRTSEVCLFDKNDNDILEAKNDLYKQEDGEWKINKELIHRKMSNNSIYYREQPSDEQLNWQIEQMRYSGEPGFMNVEEAERRRENLNGANPCMEILLDDKGMCNLTSLNVRAFVENGKLNKEKLFEAQRLSARAAYRMAQVEFELPEWNQVNKRDRLIGTSLTGWQDAMNALGWNDFELIDREEMKKEDWFKNPLKETKGIRKQKELLQELRKVARDSAEEIANELNDNVPELVTTIKPEGTQTQMPTVSSGLHFSHGEYYYRRVRINADDPLIKACEEQGYNVYPEVGEDKDNPKTKVIEFPVKAPEGKIKKDVSAIEQLEIYKMFMQNYVDHNASITIHVRDDEWREVEKWMRYNWDVVVGVSFISYSDSFYKLMPYEEISEEEYKKAIKNTPDFNPSLVSYHEQKADREREIDDSSCESGVCPIR